MSLLNIIEKADQELFLFLNSFHNESFDFIMELASDKFTWVPFYVIITALLAYRHKWNTLILLIFIALLITLTDQISVKGFKEVIERYRPCHNAEIKDMVHTVDGHCGGLYGFVSSHASNSFGLAVFLILTVRRRIKYLAPILIVWATLTSYSRIYLGVHYPLDIIGGALLGSALALLVFRLMKWLNDKYDFKLGLNE